VDGKSCFAITLIDKELHKIILSSGLLLASLAILAPIASGRQCGYGPANLAFDPIPTEGPYQRTYSDQNTDNRDLVEFSHDNIGGSTLNGNCYGAGSNASPPSGGAMASAKEKNPNYGLESAATLGNDPGEDSKVQPSERLQTSRPPDFNQDIYYKNKLEFSLDGGWLPINIPLPFDVFSGDAYNTYPLKYTLVPIIASLRWHMNDIGGPWVLRGNWDFQFSGSVTAIPRGPESRYLVYMMGMRRNFVTRNWRVAPYFDVRVGVGNIDAKGPVGVYYAQGQDLTFNFNFGSGVRYNLNSRYALSAGVNYMHISNANLSQGWGVTNYGNNVLGPMVGIDVQLRRHRRHSE
jgi:hypothetical protein